MRRGRWEVWWGGGAGGRCGGEEGRVGCGRGRWEKEEEEEEEKEEEEQGGQRE